MRASPILGIVCVVAVAATLTTGRPGLGSSDGPATNLIKNGGFETPIVPNGGYKVFYTGQTFAEWTVVGAPGNVGPCSDKYTSGGFSFPAHSGKQWLDLTGVSNSATGISQTVNTTPGAKYTLSFWVGNVVDPSRYWGVTSTVDVVVDGTHTFTATNSLGSGQSKVVWQKFTTTVSATSPTTTIAFMNRDPRTDNSNGLDDVSLVPQ